MKPSLMAVPVNALLTDPTIPEKPVIRAHQLTVRQAVNYRYAHLVGFLDYEAEGLVPSTPDSYAKALTDQICEVTSLLEAQGIPIPSPGCSSQLLHVSPVLAVAENEDCLLGHFAGSSNQRPANASGEKNVT